MLQQTTEINVLLAMMGMDGWTGTVLEKSGVE